MGSLCVNHDLRAVPWLDRGKKSHLSQVAHRNVTRPRFRPRRRIALRCLRARPIARLAQSEEVNSCKTGGEDLLAAIAILIRDEDAMHDAFILHADHAPLPFARNVVHEWSVSAAFGPARIGSGQRGVDHDQFSLSDAREAHPMAGRQAVDFGCGPRL